MSFAHQPEASTSNFQATATNHSSSKYRAYVSAVDKALKSFENTTEWADLISALGKLGKVFSTNAKLFNDIPNSVTVAKRLSQCLHPLLPSGVHLKALETYRQVFLILGRTENLPRYLYLFAIGLFPLMDHCGIKVKSELLTIFEQLLLPLGGRLRPALPGFIAAVLLGLEEGTEFYDRSSQLLEQVIEKVGAESFYACFWQAVHGSASVRLPALMFLNTKLEKRKPVSSDQMYIIAGGVHANHMITALCAVAEDPGSTLIQRHLLDSLSIMFPLNGSNILKSDLVQILQRCVFVVLRRDMSLNRRLYQWLLNRLNDSTFASHPVNGTENANDMDFLKKYSLPLIKLAIKDFLKVDVVEIAPGNTLMGTMRAKDTQVQFSEVRVCRLMHYFLDRREVGILVLNEILAMYLEFACQQDSVLIEELNAQCEELDPSYETLWEPSNSTNEQYRARRVEETRKTFNSLLNSLEVGFLWEFLGAYFVRLLNGQDENADKDGSINDEFLCDENEAHLKYFPLIVAFCLKNVQLDSHGDIRGQFLTKLLETILAEIHRRGCDTIFRDIFVAILIVARRLLQEINQSVFVFENVQQDETQSESLDMNSQSPSKRDSSQLQHKKECIEEQKLVESCLGSCFDLLSDICQWYISRRDRDKTGVLCTISALIRDFSDFPFYCFQAVETKERSPISSISDILRPKNNVHPVWLTNLIRVVDVNSWVDIVDVLDFDVRARILDLILYLYVRSVSVIDQHLAVIGRANNSGLYYSSINAQKTTTTVLLKPFFSERDLNRLENDGIFKKSALVLWTRLENSAETFNLQTAAFLLLRIHSRQIADPSSEVEDIIVSELTSADKIVSGLAAKKFRGLWVFCRSAGLEDVYTGVPLKPMNRVVMVMLGFIADDLVGTERIELRAIAYAWFVDCSRHNDLHKILQMLLMMLVNPATARVSIQFVQVDSRITRKELPMMPREVNTISLSMKNGGKQKFHHVCRDIDVDLSDEASRSITAPWNNFSFIDCDGAQQWVSELNKQLLLPTTNFAESSLRLVAESTPVSTSGKNAAAVNSHKRTISDIPQFDEEEDAESIGSFSCDSSMEHDIFEVIQFIVDAVVDDEVTVEKGSPSSDRNSVNLHSLSSSQPVPQRPSTLENSLRGRPLSSSSPFHHAGHSSSYINGEIQGNGLSDLNSSSTSITVPNNLSNNIGAVDESPGLRKGERGTLEKQHRDSVSSDRDQLHALRGTTSVSIPDSTRTIKHVKTGHRRQDSLQESIFNMNTQELRLFDPSELPSSTCPGDAKQPLLDETHSHMLFYAESPRIVDLGRAEKLFRTIGALLKSGFSLGRHIVNCLIFTNSSHLKANSSSQLVDYMIRHFKHMQNGGFWVDDDGTSGGSLNGTMPPIIPGSDKNRNPNPTLFEIFSTILLYYIRSYYLNSPTNYVSEEDLIMSWKCKIAALDCFTELLRILNDIIKEVNSKDFVSFVQQIYRFTKTQRVVIALMLAAVPSPPPQKDWRMPITTDIAEFNNGPQNQQFRDLLFAYHRSLLNLAFSLLVLEYNMQMGVKNFTVQSLGFSFERLIENRQLYNSPANRSTIRDSRLMVVELRIFIGVILNALMRCPDRHELWLQFLISAIPYLDRALPTFVVHVVEQICRNIYTCICNNFEAIGIGARGQSPADTLESPRSAIFNANFSVSDFKTAFFFADFRVPKKETSSSNSGGGSNFNEATRLSSLTCGNSSLKYPANYAVILMESLMSILHFCMIDSAAVSMPFLIARTSNSHNVYSHLAVQRDGSATGAGHHQHQSALNYSSGSSVLSGSSTLLNGAAAGGGGTSSNMVGSMVGSAISVIPGTTVISNLFGKVFTSGDNSGNHANITSNVDLRAGSESWLTAQKELIKIFPSALAILCDVWSFALKEVPYHSSAVGNSDALITLVVDTLNPIAKKHTNVLINAFGVVWISRQKTENFVTKSDNPHPSFVYSSQQTSVAKLLLSLKVLSLNSIIIATAEVLKEFASKSTKSIAEKSSGFLSEVALLEMLHECTRQVSVTDLRESWSALNILFNESPLTSFPARASFLQFIILSDFVRRCGSQAIIEDRHISRAILDICQKLTDAVNSVVGWQLESTTWLKRTLVVRQDAGNQKICDVSPTLDLKSSAGLTGSEASSMRGSMISLVPQSNRMSSVDGISQFNGSVAQMSLNSSDTTKKSSSTLRSSVKDSSSNKKDPTDSTQALFLLSDNLAELIDSICKSDDKEKLLPTLQAVWGNTLPYLKAKNAKNVRFFLASSQFLASMSSFNYMRPVWKKATMDLLLDPAFFKMDIHALRQWLVVIDNLMTNDKISFKELLARITTGPSTSLSNLITSKEQEYEMRAQSLKRLAFVILSSEIDQYSAQLNEIQERLSENLRVSQVPVVHVQVFTCYRVLLVRMRPSSFVSMWPSMVTELVQVLSQIEQQLQLTIGSGAGGSANNVVEDLKCSRDDHWLQLYLAACKLLETLCTLPCGYVAQFQMCRWAFVSALSSNSHLDIFVPFAVRINNLLNSKYSELSIADRELRSASLFNVKTLTSFQELHPFFHALATQHNAMATLNSNSPTMTVKNGNVPCDGSSQREITSPGSAETSVENNYQFRDANLINGSLTLKNAVSRIEQALYVDFADHWQL